MEKVVEQPVEQSAAKPRICGFGTLKVLAAEPEARIHHNAFNEFVLYAPGRKSVVHPDFVYGWMVNELLDRNESGDYILSDTGRRVVAEAPF